MKAGRKMKPRALKVLAGVPGGHQRDRLPAEPEYPVGWPAQPTWLDEKGVEVWRYTLEQMAAAKVVRLIDRDLLAGYCDAVSSAIEASVKSRTDAQWLDRANKTWTRARLFGALFGIGPAEAGRVQGTDAKDSNTKARFFHSA